MFRLVKPTTKYKKGFLKGTREFHREGRKKYRDAKNFDYDVFVKKMRDYEKGRNMPKGYVASSYYWLVNNYGFLGETTIRHRLSKELLKSGGHIGYGIRPTKRKRGYGKKILALGLKKAKKMGIKKALVTCNDDNIGSWKIIEANGGILQNKIKYKGKWIRRYWIVI